MITALTPVPIENVELLLVEPDEACADELEALLGAVLDQRCRVDRARSGDQALAMLGRREYQVILGEAELPGALSGVALFQQARQAQPDAVRILLAERMERARLLDAINSARVYRFFPRPWTIVDLELCLRNALSWRHNGRAMRLLLEEQRRSHDALIASLAALERTQQQMIHVERLATVGRLSTGIVHEVRNQLTALMGIFSSLRHAEGPSAVPAEQGYRIVKQLTGQIQSIQAFARASGWAYEMTDVGLGEILDQVSALYDLERGDHGLLLGARPTIRAHVVHVDIAKLAHAILAIVRAGQDAHRCSVRLRARLLEEEVAFEFALGSIGTASDELGTATLSGDDPLRAVAQMIVEAHGGALRVHRVTEQRCYAELRIPRGESA